MQLFDLAGSGRRGPLMERLRNVFLLVLGNLISAVALNIFYLPARLTMGGVSGIVSIIFQLTGRGAFLSFGLLYGLLNIPLLILGWRRIDATFVWKSLVGTVIHSVLIDLTGPGMTRFYEKHLHRAQAHGSDLLLFCLVGGVLFGVGLGLIFRAGYTTGGIDILAMVIHRSRPALSIGQFILVLDAIIILASAVAYRHMSETGLLLVLYSFIAMYVTSKSIDVILEGFDFCRTAVIVSDHGPDIADRLLTELERGVTAFSGEGMYTGTQRKILMCVLSRRQIPQMKRIVRDIDPQAFVIVQDAREVMGEGFGNFAQF